jgi:hypothetical protein
MPIVTFRTAGVVAVAYCAQHAGNRAGMDGVEVAELSAGYGVCAECFRVLPAHLARREHFNLDGQACPPWLRAV